MQDKELLEISDLKCCMSMHQPYASLLVAGIKRHEGRNWYTAHRGRLWIAATSKPVDAEDVKRVEAFYRMLYNDPQLEFPTQYPSGCLLGCVLVQVFVNRWKTVTRIIINNIESLRIVCPKKTT